MSSGSYINETTLPYAFCPGCGHGVILNQLNKALIRLQLDARKVVIVTDIGCVGLSDKYFNTNAFHGLHGRSVTYAAGIKLANPDLKVIVLMGDGGCGIGGHHLISAARRNVNVTVLVFNNLNFGMTGGEFSVSTPPGGITSTTRSGNLEHPMDICGTVAVNGATFVARATAFDKDITGLIAHAIQHDGFALVDIWELCTAYFVPNNRFSKKKLEDSLVSLNFQLGIIRNEKRPEYTRAYRDRVIDQVGLAALPPQPIAQIYPNSLRRRIHWIIAGAAGMKIVSAAAAICRAAMRSGLYVSLRSDYLVTVKSGYSIAEVIISPEKINFTGIPKAELMIVLFEEGLVKVQPHIDRLSQDDLLMINADLLPVTTDAKVTSLDFHKTKIKKENWARMALAGAVRYTNIFPIEALIDEIDAVNVYTDDMIKAIENNNWILSEFSEEI